MRLLILISLVGCVLSVPQGFSALTRDTRDIGVSGSFGQRVNPLAGSLSGVGTSENFENQEFIAPVEATDLDFSSLSGHNYEVPESSLSDLDTESEGNIVTREASFDPRNIFGIASQGHIFPGVSEDFLNTLGAGNIHGAIPGGLESSFGVGGNQGYIAPSVSGGLSSNLGIGGIASGGLSSSLGLGGLQGYTAPRISSGGIASGGLSSSLGLGGLQGYTSGIASGGLSGSLGLGLQGYTTPGIVSGGPSSNLGFGANQGYAAPGSFSGGISSDSGIGNVGYSASGSLSDGFRNSIDFGQQGFNPRGLASEGFGISTGISNQGYNVPSRVSGGFGKSKGLSAHGKNPLPYGKRCPPNQILHVDGLCVRPQVSRNVFIYRAPKLPKPYVPRPHIPKPKVLYNVVFVRTPEGAKAPDPIVVPPPQQKTVVYVLTKNGQVGQKVIEVPIGYDQEPEVFYVNYNDGDNPVLPGGITLQEALSSASSQDGQLVGGGYKDSAVGGNIRLDEPRTYGPPGISGSIGGNRPGSGIGGGFSDQFHIAIDQQSRGIEDQNY